MVEQERVNEMLVCAEGYVADLRRMARLDRLDTDIREERFVVRTTQLAIQACMAVASHVISSERLGEPRSNCSMFRSLVKGGWLEPSKATALDDLASLRNTFVYDYDKVDLAVVRDVVERRLGEIDDFIAAIRAGLAD